MLSVVDLINERQKVVLERYGLTHSQYNILRILQGVYPAAINVKQIVERMIFGSPDITRLIDRLSSKHVLERKANTLDKRKIDITLTPAGVEMLTALNPVMEATVKNFFEFDITVEEAIEMTNVLQKLKLSLMSD